MALTPGTRIGCYEIAEQIGVGGMGEMYRARDTKNWTAMSPADGSRALGYTPYSLEYEALDDFFKSRHR